MKEVSMESIINKDFLDIILHVAVQLPLTSCPSQTQALKGVTWGARGFLGQAP